MTASRTVYHMEETRYSKDDVEAMLKGAASSSVHSKSATVVWDFENSYNYAIVSLKVNHVFVTPEEKSTREIIEDNTDWVLSNLDQRSCSASNDAVAFQAAVIIRGLMAEIEKLKLDSAPL